MLVAAEEGILPKVFAYQWKNTAPRMIVLESVLVTLAATLFFVYPSVTEAYFTLSDCAVQLYLIVYFVIIFAAITLRIRYPNQQSSFRIPGGVFGLFCTAAVALVGCGAGFLIGFIPPSQFSLVNPHYFSLFILGMILMTAGLASGLYQYRRRYGYLR
jgi:amino acid transporter